MSTYFYTILMLAAVLGGIIVLARVLQSVRGGRVIAFSRSAMLGGAARPKRLSIQETCTVDGKRRLLLVQCNGLEILLMTGGPVDLVVSVLPTCSKAGA